MRLMTDKQKVNAVNDLIESAVNHDCRLDTDSWNRVNKDLRIVLQLILNREPTKEELDAVWGHVA